MMAVKNLKTLLTQMHEPNIFVGKMVFQLFGCLFWANIKVEATRPLRETWIGMCSLSWV